MARERTIVERERGEKEEREATDIKKQFFSKSSHHIIYLPNFMFIFNCLLVQRHFKPILKNSYIKMTHLKSQDQ